MKLGTLWILEYGKPTFLQEEQVCGNTAIKYNAEVEWLIHQMQDCNIPTFLSNKSGPRISLINRLLFFFGLDF